MSQVTEDRFDGGESSPVAGFAVFAVDGALHPVAVALFGGFGFTPEETDLPNLGFIWRTQAFVTLFARQAIAQSTDVFGRDVAVVNAV